MREPTALIPIAVRGDHRLDLLLGLEHRLPASCRRLMPGAADPRRRSRSTALLLRVPVGAGGRDRGRLGVRAAVLADPAVARARSACFAVLPIGGADMPVVICSLNAFTGLSAAAAGIALDNTALIVAGMLVGASGSILTKQMAEAMNRSIANVFFAGVRRRRRRARWRRRRAAAARRARRAPPTSRSSSPTRAWSSSCPATAWRSRRRSTRSPTSRPSSRSAASRSCTRSTRSPGACPAT